MNPAGKTVTHTYDSRGFRETMKEPEGGVFTYLYDVARRLSWLSNPDGNCTTYTYDNANRRVLKQLANNTSASMVYDAASQLTVVANKGMSTDNQYVYTYDGAGNRTGVSVTGGVTFAWKYDATNQLTNETKSTPAAFNTTYTYDPVGNRLGKNDSGTLTTYTYDAANQLTTSVSAGSTTTYTFDASGNQAVENAAGSLTTSTWDDENRRTRVILSSAVVNTSIYNGDGLRVQRQDSAGTTKIVWDGQTYLEETDGSNITNVIYTVEPTNFGKVISQSRKTGVTWTPTYYHLDGLGSTVRLSAGNASILNTYAYKAFGEIISSTGSTGNSFRWVGESGYYFDPDLLDDYVRARYYRPALARWLNEDPLGFQSLDFNMFRYVLNNPASSTDASGLGPCPPPTKKECNNLIDQQHALLAVMYAEVTNGKNTTLYDMLKKSKVLSDAVGYRSSDLKKQPCWFQQVVGDIEESNYQTLKSILLLTDLWIYQSLPLPNFPGAPDRLDTGNGDIWLMMEMARIHLLITRLEAACKGAQ